MTQLFLSLKQCPGCQVLTAINASFSVTTTPQMSTEINSILDRYPTVEYIRTPYSAADAFAVPSLQTRRRTDVQLISDSPTSLQMQDCYQGKNIGAVYGDDLNWVGWESVDEMNRIIQHPGVAPPPETFSVGAPPLAGQEVLGRGTDRTSAGRVFMPGKRQLCQRPETELPGGVQEVVGPRLRGPYPPPVPRSTKLGHGAEVA